MFDRFDICEAYYVFFRLYHEGQNSDKYRRLSKMTKYFKPRPSLSVLTLSPNGKSIYNRIIDKMYGK